MRNEGRREDGFTLIELRVVVLIMAILIAVAIPVMNAAWRKSKDRAVQAAQQAYLVAAGAADDGSARKHPELDLTGAARQRTQPHRHPWATWKCDGGHGTSRDPTCGRCASPPTVRLAGSGPSPWGSSTGDARGGGTTMAPPPR